MWISSIEIEQTAGDDDKDDSDDDEDEDDGYKEFELPLPWEEVDLVDQLW